MSGPWEDYGPAKDGPWSDYASPKADAEPVTGAGEAALEHYGNTALMGYLPHVQALTEAHPYAMLPLPLQFAAEKFLGKPDPSDGVDAKLKAQGFDIQQPDQSYLASRDANLKRLALEGKEHPVASGLGTAAGIAASSLIPGGAVAKEATLGAKALQGAGMGALYGAVANPGDQEGEIDPLQLGSRAKDAAIGAGIGAAVPTAIEGISKGASKLSGYLGKKAPELAEKATGATAKEAEGFAPGTGRELLDRKIVKFGSSPKGIAANAESAMDAAEASKQALTEGGLSGTKVDRNTVYNYIRDKINSLKGDESQLGLAKKLESKLEDITGVGNETGAEVPLTASEKIRRGFDKAAKWASNSDATELEANKIVANAYRDAGEQAANQTSETAGKAFKDAKTTQRLLIPVRDAAERRAGVLNQSPLGGLADIAAAGVAGVPGVIAKRAVFPRLASSLAVTADKASNALGTIPGTTSKINPIVAQAVAQRLGQGAPSFDPESDSILKNQQLMDIFRQEPERIDAIQDDKTRNLIKRSLHLPTRKVSSE